MGSLLISSELVSGSHLAGRGGRHQYDLGVDPVAAKEFLDDLATVMSSAVEYASRGRTHGADYWLDPHWISKNREIESRVHLAQRVVQEALGEQIKLIRGSGSYGTDWEDALEYVDRARGALAHHATEQLIFEGSGPKLRADGFIRGYGTLLDPPGAQGIADSQYKQLPQGSTRRPRATHPGVVRVGDTVRRPRTANSEFVAELLDRLAGSGLGPQSLGTDAVGRDVFEFLDGHGSDHHRTEHPMRT